MTTITNQTNWQQVTWHKLYDAFTPRERDEMVKAMLQRIESQEQESIEIYKMDPGLLTSLSVSALRELADRVAGDAHKQIVARHPETAALLLAFECLTSFSMGRDEPINYNDLADVISSLKEVWESVATETKGTQE